MSEKKLKPLHSWLIFGGSMVIVFLLGLVVSSLMERRAEVASIFNNRKNPLQGIVAQNQRFKSDFPREYETWKATEETDFRSKYMSSDIQDVLEERPNMVVLYAFSWTTILPAAISTPWRIIVKSFVQVFPQQLPTAPISPAPAGLAKVRMFPA